MGLLGDISSAVGGAVGGVASGFTGAAGMQNEFQADPYQVNQAAFTDPNAAANKESLAAALAQRQAMATPQAQAASMQAAQAGGVTIDQGASNQARGGMMNLASALQARASGQAPSVAEGQMRQGMDQAIASQRSLAASQRGMTRASANRLAAQGIAAAQLGTAANAAQLRAGEQANAEQSLAGVLSNVRQGDMGMATNQAGLTQQTNLANAGFSQQANQSNAGFQQQTGLANQQAELEAQRQKDQMSQFYTGSSLGIDAQGFQAQQNAEQMNMNAYNTAQGINAGVAAGNTQLQGQMVGGLLSAGGTALASDERIKEDVKSGERTSAEFLEAIHAKRFRYKGQDTEHLGVMAQDVEKAPGGAGMVRELGGVKHIDVPQAVGRLLATSATLHDRLKRLEAKRAAKRANKAG